MPPRRRTTGARPDPARVDPGQTQPEQRPPQGRSVTGSCRNSGRQSESSTRGFIGKSGGPSQNEGLRDCCRVSSCTHSSTGCRSCPPRHPRAILSRLKIRRRRCEPFHTGFVRLVPPSLRNLDLRGGIARHCDRVCGRRKQQESQFGSHSGQGEYRCRCCGSLSKSGVSMQKRSDEHIDGRTCLPSGSRWSRSGSSKRSRKSA
jgi:hypothetical protein